MQCPQLAQCVALEANARRCRIRLWLRTHIFSQATGRHAVPSASIAKAVRDLRHRVEKVSSDWLDVLRNKAVIRP